MSECKWCDKILPAEEIPICSSCVLRSRDEAIITPEDQKSDPEGVKINYDLSGLANSEKPKTRKGKSVGKVSFDLISTIMAETKAKKPISNQEILMKKVKVHSNSIRSRIFVVDGALVLNFDENGVAECFESDVPRINAYSRFRPNRIWAVVEESPKKKATPKTEKKSKKKAEKKTEGSKPKTDEKSDTPKKSVFKALFNKESE